MFHGGVWMQAASWPPAGTRYVQYHLGRRTLTEEGAGGGASGGEGAKPRPPRNIQRQSSGVVRGEGAVERGRIGEKREAWQERPEGEPDEGSPAPFTPAFPAPGLLHSLDASTTFPYDPRNPCPSIGGNVFGYQNILMAGAYDQHERADHFLCSPPYLPLSSRRDVVVFRTAPLAAKLDITGTPVVVLYVASTAVDTDFTVKLIDEYPPSMDYPQGFAMQVTHGIQRVRYRESREKATFMEPGKVYRVEVTMYPTSNLFSKGSDTFSHVLCTL